MVVVFTNTPQKTHVVWYLAVAKPPPIMDLSAFRPIFLVTTIHNSRSVTYPIHTHFPLLSPPLTNWGAGNKGETFEHTR